MLEMGYGSSFIESHWTCSQMGPLNVGTLHSMMMIKIVEVAVMYIDSHDTWNTANSCGLHLSHLLLN